MALKISIEQQGLGVAHIQVESVQALSTLLTGLQDIVDEVDSLDKFTLVVLHALDITTDLGNLGDH